MCHFAAISGFDSVETPTVEDFETWGVLGPELQCARGAGLQTLQQDDMSVEKCDKQEITSSGLTTILSLADIIAVRN